MACDRFDHSPCDPSIHLKGSPSNVFACVVCTRRFDTHGAWMLHLQSKVGLHCCVRPRTFPPGGMSVVW